MKNLVSSLEDLLPHWLEKTQMQWVQWVYALWQIVRCNPLTLLVLSFLPFRLMQLYKKKTVVVVGDYVGYTMPVNEMLQYISSTKTMKLEKRIQFWCIVKHGNYYYVTHQNTPCELAKCCQLFGDDIIFVENELKITESLSVGKILSQTEAYEKVFTKSFHCSKGSAYVVPTWFDYVDLSSKFWLVFSSIPILLQARNYNRFSNLMSLFIIVLDLNRKWLYKLYDRNFDRFAKFVKLHIFKKRSALYNLCSIFSVRWKYCDTVKKHAYVAEPGEKMILKWYSKLESPNDIEIVRWVQHSEDPNDQNICMEIVKDRAHFSLMRYGELYAEVVLHRRIYVSEFNLRSYVSNTDTADEVVTSGLV